MRWGRATSPDPHDVPWREVEYCVIDIETTGLDLRRDDIVSYGAVLIREGRLAVSTARYSTVKPRRPLQVGAVSTHHLRTEDLLDAPDLADVAPEILDQLRNRVVVAHAAWIEKAFLSRALPIWGRSGIDMIDTAALSRAVGTSPSGTGHEPNIEYLADHLGVCAHSPHHALGDAATTAEIFLAVVARLQQQQDTLLTTRTLLDLSRKHELS